MEIYLDKDIEETTSINEMMDELVLVFPQVVDNIELISFLTKELNNGN
jgi:hypothetical protein